MSANAGLAQLERFNSVWYTRIEDTGVFPNNPSLALILYKSLLPFEEPPSSTLRCSPDSIEQLFGRFGWGSSWRNGIYAVHHFHSTAHEVLGVYRGEVTVVLGGEGGLEIELNAGDAVLIPAGVAHKNVASSGDFRTVGAYPIGQVWDVCYGNDGERPQVDRNIEATGRPMMDPVYGENGPLSILW